MDDSAIMRWGFYHNDLSCWQINGFSVLKVTKFSFKEPPFATINKFPNTILCAHIARGNQCILHTDNELDCQRPIASGTNSVVKTA